MQLRKKTENKSEDNNYIFLGAISSTCRPILGGGRASQPAQLADSPPAAWASGGRGTGTSEEDTRKIGSIVKPGIPQFCGTL